MLFKTNDTQNVHNKQMLQFEHVAI